MEGMLERRVTLGTVTFDIRKLLAPEVFEIYEVLRPSLALFTDLLTQVDIDNMTKEQAMASGLTLIARIPRGIVDEVTPKLFKQVFFTVQGESLPQPLGTKEAMERAFANLDAIHIYVMIARAAAVNFSGSWDVLRLLMPEIDQAFKQRQPETSTPSSPTP